MTGTGLFVSVRATLKRWAQNSPVLFRHDPLFRYAAIAAFVAVIFLTLSIAQDDSRYSAVGGTDKAPGAKATATARTGMASAPAGPRTAEPPAPGSSPDDARPLNIAPGRSIEGIDLTPAHDDFGTLPRKGAP